MTTVAQRSFSGGEISPSLYARVDYARYASSLRTCRNSFIFRHGGAANRPGTGFVGEVSDSSKKVRLIPFVFNNEQTYVLEFGNLYMRVIRDGAHALLAAKTITGITQANPAVVTSNAHGFSNGDEVYISGVAGMTQVNGRNFKVVGTAANTFQLDYMNGDNVNSTGFTAYSSGGTAEEVYTITTPYVEAALVDLQFVQSADVITIVHPDYTPRDLARTGHTSWTLTEVAFTPEVGRPTGLSGTAGAAGANTYQYTVTAIANETYEESIRATSGTVLTITGITQANPGVVTSASHGLSNGDRVYITSVAGMTQVNDRQFIAAGVTTNTFQLQDTDTTSYTAYSSGGGAARTFVTIPSAAVPTSAAPNVISWTAASGAIEYNVYRSLNGIFGLIGVSGGTTFNDTNIDPDTSNTAPIQRNPFQDSGNYPSAVTYYQQRLMFANSDNDPETVWGSRSGNFTNFAVSSPVQDDDAITFNIAGRQVNSVKHMLDLGKLLVLTQGGEWAVQASGGVLKPNDINAQQYSYNGSSNLYPIVINGSALYVQERGAIVRDIAFDFQVDGYRGNDLTILSTHLFEGYTLTDWAYQKTPNSVVWCVRSDGVLLSMTYIPEQELIAWARHDFGTDICENVCVVPEGDEDALYVTVKRSINGATKRYIERMNTRQVLNRWMTGGNVDFRDLKFMDCHLTYDGRNTSVKTLTLSGGTNWTYLEDLTLTASASTFVTGDVGNEFHLFLTDSANNITDVIRCEVKAYTSATVVTVNANKTVPASLRSTATTKWAKAVDEVTGLWHIEGKNVSVLGDGFVIASPNNASAVGITVSSGAITLDKPYSVIHVGLPYISEIETLDIDTAQGSPLADKNKLITAVTLFVENTRGVWVGPKPPSDDDTDPLENLRELKLRNSEGYDSAVDLTTGPVDINIKGEWNNNGRVFIRQVDPVPMAILAVMPSGNIPFTR